jgi:Domain of unknown function (DUF4173)
MNKDIIKITLVTAGAFLFNLVFWQEKLGVNTLLFDAFLISALFYLYPNAGQHSTVRWLLLGHLLCLAMVLVHNTLLSKIAFTVTLLLVAAFAEYIHRSAWFAGGSVLMNIIMVVASFTESLQVKREKRAKRRNVGRFIRFAFFPLVIVMVFFAIYFSANSVFQEKASLVLNEIGKFFANFFDFFSWERGLFLLLGLFITGCVLLKSKLDYFSRKETAYIDSLQRTKKSWRERKDGAFFQFIELVMGRFARGMMALKNEYTTGIISVLLLNLLLVVINIIDVDYIWFNFVYDERQPIYKMVHEGTEWLILSIVLAMAILMFFFKGNLNFYRKNKWLKYGATAWIIQNAILVFSVSLRDYYYIEHHGLAYKRIGVLFFLLMVLIGLTTVLIKIWLKKSSYFLFRVNAWAGITVLVLSTTFHWDEVIAGYNLQRKDTVTLDVPFLLSLSDKTLPLLEKNRDVLQDSSGTFFVNELQRREQLFLNKQQDFSWLSWNYADASVKKYLEQKRQYHLLNTN